MTIEAVLAEARALRTTGRVAEALTCYQQAAEAALQADAPRLRLAALRHVSDIAREQGDASQALAAGTEAARLAQALGDVGSLEQANALRVHALALELGGEGDAAPATWQRARALYAAAGVAAGVAECDQHLG